MDLTSRSKVVRWLEGALCGETQSSTTKNPAHALNAHLPSLQNFMIGFSACSGIILRWMDNAELC